MDWIAAYAPLLDLVILSSGLAISQYIALRAGAFSVATAGLAAIGAYAAAILATRAGWHPAPALLAGTACGAAAALVLSLPLARLRGVFQAIATVAFVQIVLSLLLYAEPLTGGAMGLNGIPKAAGTGVLLVFLVGLMALLRAIDRYGIGRAFDTIRQDETVAVSFGISVAHYHRLAFALSGAVAGLTGGLMAFHNYSLVPEEFGFSMLVAALAFVVLGGTRAIWGPLVGATILSLLPEVSRSFAEYRLLIHGALLMIVIAWLQHGVADTFIARHARRRRAAAGGA